MFGRFYGLKDKLFVIIKMVVGVALSTLTICCRGLVPHRLAVPGNRGCKFLGTGRASKTRAQQGIMPKRKKYLIVNMRCLWEFFSFHLVNK